jgi:hypothetical protein
MGKFQETARFKPYGRQEKLLKKRQLNMKIITPCEVSQGVCFCITMGGRYGMKGELSFFAVQKSEVFVSRK